MPSRKDPITRRELFDFLSNKVVEITYTPKGATRKVVRVTLLHDYIKELDNFPMGFETTYEVAMFEMHAITCLDIDSNRWLSIDVADILRISVP